MSLEILVVDDSKTIRGVIKKTLLMTDLNISNIHEATNGAEALELLRKTWVDLVLTDINMPVMTGIELVSTMAEDAVLKDVPVIVISTDGSATRIEELEKKGIRAYVRKPFTPEHIAEKISNVLGVGHVDRTIEEGT